MEAALALAAYDSVNEGEEAQSTIAFAKSVQNQLSAANITTVDSFDLINWLIGKNTLVPYSGARISFFHQSITEYLASIELTKRYVATPHELREKLGWKRWDQALFLCLSLLNHEKANVFLDEIIKFDFLLALRAVKFMETDSEEVVDRLLLEIARRGNESFELNLRIAWALEEELPIKPAHESKLRDIVKIGDSIGGAAAVRLLELRGPKLRDEILQYMSEHYDDYNFCTTVGRRLAPFVTGTDLPCLVDLADRVQRHMDDDEDVEDAGGFSSGIASALRNVDLGAVYEAFFDRTKPLSKQTIRIEIIYDVLNDRSSGDALAIAGEMLLLGATGATVCIRMIELKSDDDATLDWSTFGTKHCRALVDLLGDKEHGPWALEALRVICKARPDLAGNIRNVLKGKRAIMRASLYFAMDPANSEPIFGALAELLSMPAKQVEQEPIELLSRLEINWLGRQDLFLEILRLRNTRLAYKLLDSINSRVREPTLGQVEIGSVEWWLEWMQETTTTDEGWMFLNRMPHFLANHSKADTQAAFVTEFNCHSRYRRVLAEHILVAFRDLTTDQFSDDSISFLLADLSRKDSVRSFRGHLLGSTATEAFVMERLLPLLATAQEPLRGNLIQVLHQAGDRHGRRYIPL